MPLMIRVGTSFVNVSGWKCRLIADGYPVNDGSTIRLLMLAGF